MCTQCVVVGRPLTITVRGRDDERIDRGFKLDDLRVDRVLGCLQWCRVGRQAGRRRQFREIYEFGWRSWVAGSRWAAMSAAVAVVLGGLVLVSAPSPVAAAGVWSDAIPVPGLAALNNAAVGDASVRSVSCAAPGECSATGTYKDTVGIQGFVVSQVGGVWGTAIPIPGLAGLNTGGNAFVSSVSCAAPGQCSATGNYKNIAGSQGFVVSQVAGVWGTAIPIPGLAGLNSGGDTGVASVSCALAGGVFCDRQLQRRGRLSRLCGVAGCWGVGQHDHDSGFGRCGWVEHLR